jgi:disulfide bond formation protein DsbB
MSLETYSLILTLGSIGIFLGLLLCSVLYFVASRVREHIHTHPYNRYIASLCVLATVSVIGSLIYQLVYQTPVCELCWWQRIFLYPTVIITAVALWFKTKETHVTVAVLSSLGLFYALYHYYYHFQGFVLGNKLTLPCSFGGLLPACTSSPILVFGFVTIPFMGIMVFGSLLMLTGFAYAVYRRESNTRNR